MDVVSRITIWGANSCPIWQGLEGAKNTKPGEMALLE